MRAEAAVLKVVHDDTLQDFQHHLAPTSLAGHEADRVETRYQLLCTESLLNDSVKHVHQTYHVQNCDDADSAALAFLGALVVVANKREDVKFQALPDEAFPVQVLRPSLHALPQGRRALGAHEDIRHDGALAAEVTREVTRGLEAQASENISLCLALGPRDPQRLGHDVQHARPGLAAFREAAALVLAVANQLRAHGWRTAGALGDVPPPKPGSIVTSERQEETGNRPWDHGQLSLALGIGQWANDQRDNDITTSRNVGH
eukprot:9084215-Pyramimonas_sp.AAC.2